MSANPLPNDQLLLSYAAGTCTAAERELVEAWISQNPEQGGGVLALQKHAANSQTLEPRDVNPVWSHVSARLAELKMPARTTTTTNVPRFKTWGALALAAGAFGLVFALWQPNKNLPNQSAYTTRTTAAGQRARITLSDGSTVILAPESRIRYNTDFGISSRTVQLEGRALFTVTQADGIPFVINTGATTTRVLGTSFMISKYSSDSAVRVVVAQGKISFNSTILSTGDAATVVDNGSAKITHDVTMAKELAWAEGRLILDNMKLRDAIPELERWYGINIAVNDVSLLQQPVLATFSTQSSREALTGLAIALGAKVKFDERQVVLTAK